MLYGPVYYRHVLRKPPQDDATIAARVVHVLRRLGARAELEPAAPESVGLEPATPEAAAS